MTNNHRRKLTQALRRARATRAQCQATDYLYARFGYLRALGYVCECQERNGRKA